MRSTRGILLASTLLAATATTAAAAEPEWIKQFGTTSRDEAFGVSVGPDGRVHVVGHSIGQFFRPSEGSAFVITFDREGSELWRRQPGTTSSSDNAAAVATDAEGNVYVAGYTGGDLPGYPADAFVIAFDRDGRILWNRQRVTTASDGATGVATDADGNVYVAGWTEGAQGGTHKGDRDAFLIKYDRAGRIVWKRQPGTSKYDMGNAVATDSEGNVYLVGYTGGSLGGPFKRGYRDAFVMKFDRNGRYLWKRQPGTTERDEADAVATDTDGNVYVVGNTASVLGGTFKGGASDAFVLKFDRDGTQVWRRQPGTPRGDWALAVTSDADGSVHVAGYTLGAFDGAKNGAGDDWDAFVIKYDRDGRNVWRDQPGSTELDRAQGIATDADGNVYVVGVTHGKLPGTTDPALLNGDAFVIKYGPDGPQ